MAVDPILLASEVSRRPEANDQERHEIGARKAERKTRFIPSPEGGRKAL
jgi:hypothetical protein